MAPDSEIPENVQPAESNASVGRTGWDVVVSVKWFIVFAVAAVVATVLLYVAYREGYDVVGALATGAPYAVFAVGGYFAGWVFARLISALLDVPGRVCFYTDMKSMRMRVLLIPEPRYRTLSAHGAIMSFSTGGGRQAYLLRSFDDEAGTLDYGFIHTGDPEQVFAVREAYLRWEQDLIKTKAENVMLTHYPDVLGAEMAKISQRISLEDIETALGLRYPDVSVDVEPGVSKDPEPEASPEEVPDEQPDA